MAELWDMYNQERKKTGHLHERGTPILQGFYHLVVSIWIVNSQGQYLMSQRHPSKPYPEYWECTGGSVIAGENSLQGAIREVKEELGLSLDADTAQLIYQTRREDCQDFYDVWLFHFDINIKELTLQNSEVINACWMSKEAINILNQMNKLHPLLSYYQDILMLG